jgi:hypothetical protein
MVRSHAAGRPAHADRQHVSRFTYAVAGSALLCGSVYALAALLFGDAGRAVIGWVLIVMALLSLGALGLVLIGCSIPDEYRPRQDDE